ncbi:MAG: hypothetical protein AVDCRST_MAG37-1835, partial [uncultured Rubrobacteraceae bacterium]
EDQPPSRYQEVAPDGAREGADAARTQQAPREELL